MSILSEIIEWAKKQDHWKQDAIRRILQNGDYTEEDVFEIAKILLHNHGYIDSAPTPIQIDKLNFPKVEGAENKVILKKIKSPKNVNALLNETELQFALSGLTIIYGENGTGKSGYIRILKKCCKARGIDNILPDIFAKEKSQTSTATIFYSYNNNKKEIEWIDGQYNGGELEQLLVYDSKCGKIQVTDKNELIYLPNGMDIFKKLVDCLREVKKEIEKEKPQEITINFNKIDRNTSIFKKIDSINKNTNKRKIINELQWSEDHDKELTKVSRKILDINEVGLEKQITAITKESQSLETIKQVVVILETVFSEEKIQNIFAMVENKKESQIVLDELTKEMQKEEMLKGTGNKVWQAMYSAAKEFSLQSAYENSNYPNLEGQCVLCQQDLSNDAKERMKAFSKFAEGKIKKNFDDIVSKISESIQYLEKLDSQIQSSNIILDTSFSCLLESDLNIIIEHLKSLDNQRIKLINFLKSNSELQKDDILFKDSILEKLDQVILDTKQKEIELVNMKNPETLNKLKKRKLELESLKLANSRVNEICKYIDYLNNLDKFNLMIKKLEHGTISRQGNIIITDSLKKSFFKALSTELTKLGGEKIPLLLDSSTRNGKPTFQLGLKGVDIYKK